MGNLLSYQFWAKLTEELGDTDAMFEAGNFAPVLEWLRSNIYAQGKRFTPKDLVKRVTGRPMDASDYIAGLDKKYRELYSI
jgi:carboxypeptidase Taq